MLYQIHNLQMFSFSPSYLFILITVSFEEQKNLNFDEVEGGLFFYELCAFDQVGL